MSLFEPSRRGALAALAQALVAPSLTFALPARAASTPLRLATGALPPLTSEGGRTGFLDALAHALFERLDIDATLLRLPVERALINANAGIEDGDMFRAPGFEAAYPNLVQIPEKVLDFDFVALATRADVEVRQWGDLRSYGVAWVTGWKLFERNAKAARETTTVRELPQLLPLVASGRVDIALADRWQMLWLAREARLPIRVLDPPLARAPMFAYLHRRHAALVAPAASALAHLKRDGTWQRLYDEILRPLEPRA